MNADKAKMPSVYLSGTAEYRFIVATGYTHAYFERKFPEDIEYIPALTFEAKVAETDRLKEELADERTRSAILRNGLELLIKRIETMQQEIETCRKKNPAGMSPSTIFADIDLGKVRPLLAPGSGEGA